MCRFLVLVHVFLRFAMLPQPTRYKIFVSHFVLFVGICLIANSLFLWVTHLLTALVFLCAPLAVTERFKGYHQKAVQRVPPLGIVLMGLLLIWVKGLRF